MDRRRRSHRLSASSDHPTPIEVCSDNPDPTIKPEPQPRKRRSDNPGADIPPKRQKSTKKVKGKPSRQSLAPPAAPASPTELIRINIVHSMGQVTTLDINSDMTLRDLFLLHHSAGGREPCVGLALQQRGRLEVVGDHRYWVSGDGPTYKYFWGEDDTRKISETDWTFGGDGAWLACIYDGGGGGGD